MLNFTLDRGSFIGAYNGRFVFHAPDALEAASDIYLRMIAEGHSDALVKDVFKHEYLHWVTFRSSWFGISTIGRRYRARTEYLRGNEAEVRDYYKQRTAYFCCSYQTHENIVAALENKVIPNADTRSLKKTKLSHTQKKQIKEADRQSKSATIELSAQGSRIQLIMDYINGLRAASEFGLQAYVRNAEGKLKGREVSLKSLTFGIFNAAFDKDIGPSNFLIRRLKGLRRKFNRERRIGGYNKRAMARWAAIKFTTEYKTLQKLNQLGYPTPFDYDRYCNDISMFAHRHTLNGDKIMERHLVAILQSCKNFHRNHDEFEELVEMFENLDKPILYFFYVHGN